MSPKDRADIKAAIHAAEAGTTGVVAVRIVPGTDLDAFERARHEFERVGLHRHRHENAALVLVAPKARRFAVIGDKALHERVGDAFWNGVVDEIRPYFARDAIAGGIVRAVQRIGEQFREHFSAPEESA